jgi:acetoacetyl-CoA synthase
VRDFVLDNIPPLVDKLLSRAGLGPGDVGCFVPHQANGRLIGELAERCGLGGVPLARVVERYGNLGSASVPVALDDAVRSGVVTGGDVVLLAGFGGGMAAGVGLVRWSSTTTTTSGSSS